VDALSRRPDHNDESENNKQIVALPNKLFAKAVLTLTLDEAIQ